MLATAWLYLIRKGESARVEFKSSFLKLTASISHNHQITGTEISRPLNQTIRLLLQAEKTELSFPEATNSRLQKYWLAKTKSMDVQYG